MDFKDIMAAKKPTTASVTIQLDGTLADEIEQLGERIRYQIREDRRSNDPDLAPKMQRELEGLLDKAKESEAVFVFRSIGRKNYDDLVGKHQPSKDQRSEGFMWDPDGFPPALIAAASMDPEITAEEADEIWSSPDWSPGELVRLFQAALSCNTEVKEIPFDSNAFARTGSFERKLPTALSEESPEASS